MIFPFTGAFRQVALGADAGYWALLCLRNQKISELQRLLGLQGKLYRANPFL